MAEEIQEMIDRYETLAHKLNCMSIKAPLRFKVAICDEMNQLRGELEESGLSLDEWGWWN